MRRKLKCPGVLHYSQLSWNTSLEKMLIWCFLFVSVAVGFLLALCQFKTNRVFYHKKRLKISHIAACELSEVLDIIKIDQHSVILSMVFQIIKAALRLMSQVCASKLDCTGSSYLAPNCYSLLSLNSLNNRQPTYIFLNPFSDRPFRKLFFDPWHLKCYIQGTFSLSSQSSSFHLYLHFFIFFY